ncbi:acyl-CoA dehydrogenase family protein [Beijerinckia mobilis]|uniref:acyl-CoA dehydrogenase family protein n=1 Tax=Beijerinckia mobilis TaxID=231434 RepID=UPI0005571751|nr:acyl-CoA dehydrogenase family protein [Beijerinckia mobilis]
MTHWQLTEEQGAIEEMARSFGEEHIAPYALEWDEKKHFPHDTLRHAANLGMAGIYVDEDIGGSGLKRIDAVVIFEALAKACPSTAAFLSIHNMVAWMIASYGAPAQRTEWVPRLCRMDWVGSYCLTEPSVGSDAAALRTRAVRDGDYFIVNGTKQFISGAGSSDVYIVMARTGAEGPKGISALVIFKDMEGVSFGSNERKMGWNTQPTRTVNFDNVAVPVSHLLGAEGDGFKIAMAGLDGGRLNIAACSIGGAQSALDKSIRYMSERSAFGSTLDRFQALQFRIADMATDLAAARIFLHHAAHMLDEKLPDATMTCAMAKRFATDIGFSVANEALQLHGGYGYLAEYGIEKIVRDLRVHQILEGTNEIMRVIIARALLGR